MFDSIPPKIRHDQFEAEASNNELVNIKDSSRDEEVMHCVFCKCKMIRVRGEDRAWHYRHNYKSLREKHIECTYDLYLQALTEKKLKDWYSRIDSLCIRYAYNHVCSKFDDCNWHSISEVGCSHCQYDTFDVKKKFSEITSSEIVRTTSLSSHRLYKLYAGEDKSKSINLIISAFEKESQIKMPEGQTIVVQIENEKDIDKLLNLTEIKECREISFYNFKVNNRPNVEHVGKIKLSQMKLFESGKLFFGSGLCTETAKGPKADVVINYNHNAHLSSIKNWLMAIASREPYSQHYCPMCKSRYYSEGKFYCKQTGEELNVNFPVSECDNYEAEEILITKKIDEFKTAIKEPSADIEIIINKNLDWRQKGIN